MLNPVRKQKLAKHYNDLNFDNFYSIQFEMLLFSHKVNFWKTEKLKKKKKNTEI
jgi:hypothetical protein